MKSVENTFLASLLAGAAISIGAAVNLACDNRYVGAVLFSIGLLCVCCFKWDLFTGKVPYARTAAEWSRLPIVWGGNVLGAFLMATLILDAKFSAGTFDRAIKLWTGKLNTGFAEIFMSAVCCNVLIYIAVEGYKTITDHVGKYLFVVLAVSVFVLCGFDHCIANIAYATIAKCPAVYCLPAIITVTAGNTLGGLLAASLHNMVKELG